MDALLISCKEGVLSAVQMISHTCGVTVDLTGLQWSGSVVSGREAQRNGLLFA